MNTERLSRMIAPLSLGSQFRLQRCVRRNKGKGCPGEIQIRQVAARLLSPKLQAADVSTAQTWIAAVDGYRAPGQRR